VTEATYLHHQPDGFHVTRAAFRPHVSMIFSFWSPDLCMITLAPKVMEVERIGPVGRFAIETLGLRHRPLLSQKDTVKVERVVREMPSQVDLSDAEVVVAGGKGMQAGENFRLLEELADLLGGTVAATRMAVDMKWRSRDSMVGVTGKVVSPGLYVACGISGAIQHLMGMQSAETIIAINTDPNAPIFRVATLGIVGDAREVLPVMIDAFREARSDADRQENSA
jgi:electron transfer flavoprotein alpha subunit